MGSEDWKTPLGVYERAIKEITKAREEIQAQLSNRQAEFDCSQTEVIAELRKTREEIQSELQNLKQIQPSLVELPKLKADLQNSQLEIQNLKTELAATQKVANEAQSRIDKAEREASVAQKELQTLKELMNNESNRNPQIIELLTTLQEKISHFQATTPSGEGDGFKTQDNQSISELRLQIFQLYDELTLFSQASGVEYFQLRDLLDAKKWKEADQETYSYILKISQRETERWLNDGEIKQFPSHDLRIIDRLWLKYSEGKFGFSVQKRIWQEVNGDYKRFGNDVKWLANLEKSEWHRYENYTFDLNAPEGHLPSTVRIIGLGYRDGIELPHRLKLFLSKCWLIKNY